MTHFSDLINIEEFWDKRSDFSTERWNVTFYCKDCKDIVDVERPNTSWYTFICKVCGSKDISIWTTEWIIDMYKIKK